MAQWLTLITLHIHFIHALTDSNSEVQREDNFSSSLQSSLRHHHQLGGQDIHLEGNLELGALFFFTIFFLLLFMNFHGLNL